MRKKLEQETKDKGKTEDDKLNTKDLATNAKLPKLVVRGDTHITSLFRGVRSSSKNKMLSDVWG